MTNGEKYKTAQERAKEFKKFCDDNYENNGGCQECILFPYKLCDCKFAWLDLEAEEEKPLPCPFCGREMDVSTSNCAILCVCGYSSPIDRNLSKVIAAHNRVAKAVKQSEEATNGND